MIRLRNLRRLYLKSLKQPAYAYSTMSRRLKAYCSYHMRRGRSAPPESLTFILTHRCNLHCRMCGQRGASGARRDTTNQEEISLDTLKRLIDDVSRFSPGITLFGGEPLLHPSCIPLIGYIKGKGLHCLMITNGVMLEDSADEIASSGLDELNISIDGMGRRHDRIRGMPFVYERIIKGIKRIQSLKRIGNRRMPLINIQCTINKSNFEHLSELLDVANEIRADTLTFHNLIFLDHAVLNRQKEFDAALGCSSADWEGFVFDPGVNPYVVHKTMKEIGSASRRRGMSVDFYPNFSGDELARYYKDTLFVPRQYTARCCSPWLAAYIFPNGDVRPCLNLDYSFGNITGGRFREIWNSPEALRFRRFLKKKKCFPVCARCTELYRY